MGKIENLKNNWTNFGFSFLRTAELSCKEMMHFSNESDRIRRVFDYYIPTIFNLKHGIEVFLKCFVVILQEKELLEKDHDQMKIFEKLLKLVKDKEVKKRIEEVAENNKQRLDWSAAKKRVESIDDKIMALDTLVRRYYNCTFLEDKINNNFSIIDSKNTAFRYPQNNLQMELDYSKILCTINSGDIEKLHGDILELEKRLVDLWQIFQAKFEINKYFNNTNPGYKWLKIGSIDDIKAGS